jgi:beta-mannosidase
MLAEASWLLASTPPNQVADPWQLEGLALSWTDAAVPGAVAHAGADGRDWWYRCSFTAEPHDRTLRFDGLATIAQVWLNGALILESDNMFLRHRVDVAALLRAENELVLCFRSLDAALAKKRPRPRWKTRLVRQQQLRWFRTTLLGRISGWAPDTLPGFPLVGPWRAIAFDERVSDIDVSSRMDGEDGVVDLSCSIAAEQASGTFAVGGVSTELRIEPREGGVRASAQVRVENPALWWPHTHGTPALHDCTATIAIDGVSQTIDCGRIGFRTIEALQDDGDFELRVNGVSVFCRGACWTPGDLGALELLRDAGANMVRIGGTMFYESDAFYRRCDELGLLVWQDFMFANMDYPADDAQFVASVREEATQQLQRLRRHPCLAVYCGNSEVEQQAAMLGMPRELWRSALFGELLPELCARWHPGAVYVPSSPSGGALPFHTGTGITHYYGVGAYLRPVADARRADVRFAAESLGFANVPSQEVIDEVLEGDAFALHDPRWKARTPRDTGSAWDFEDVRDHYLRERFGIDPVQLRSFDPQRYLELSRVVTGEVMAQVYSEWRSTRSRCRGALIWFLRDLWPGAGWGILDSRGAPKACFYDLRRIWQPRTVVLTDEGLDGLHAHVLNETAHELAGSLELTLLRDGHVVIAQATTPVHVAPRSSARFEADALLGTFYDTANAYRFGPPKHDVAIATLTEAGEILGEAFHFPHPQVRSGSRATVTAEAHAVDENTWQVTVQSDRFLYAVHLETAAFIADDDYFHLPPGRSKTVTLKGSGKLRGSLTALNLEEAVPISIPR